MNIVKPLTAVLSALAISGTAHGAIMTGSSGSAANTVTDYSSASLVSFDLDMRNFSSTTLNFVIEADDLLQPFLGLNALVRNFSGHGLSHVNFKLDGISYAAAGSVTPAFGTVGNTSFSSNDAAIDFSAPEWAEFHFGNPLAAAGKTDWQLSTLGLSAGDTFSITASVPEPGSIALMLSALLLMAYTRRNQQK